MAADQFFKQLLVIVFAGAIVALGAQELHKAMETKRAGRDERQKARELVKALQGGDVKPHASYSNKPAGTIKNGKIKPAASPAKQESAADQLTRKDRSELKELLDKIAQ